MKENRVCHIVFNYLPFSQNWLYHQITAVDNFSPAICVWGEITNRRYFPLREVWPAYKVNKKSVKAATYFRQNGFWPQMAELFESLQPSVIHAHFGINGIAALALKQHYNLPLITSFYGYDAGVCAQKSYWKDAYKKLFGLGEFFLVEGPHMRSILMGLGCPHKKIIIQRMGVDLKGMKFAPKSVVSNKPFYVVMAGRMVEKKGHLTGLRAFAGFVENFPTARLKIIGEGKLLERVKELAQKLKINSRIVFSPNLNHHEYLQAIQDSHVFLQPSQTAADGDMEGGAPVSLLEAQALGLGVVATNHADIPSYVLDNKSGLLAPEKDWRKLAAHLLKLATTPGLLTKMGQKGRKHVELKYNLTEQRKKLAAIYQRALKPKPIAAASLRVPFLPFLKDAAAIFTLNADWSSAEEVNQQIIRLDKNNWRALWDLAQFAEKKKDFQHAVTYWNRTLQILEQDLKHHPGMTFQAGTAAFHLGLNQIRQEKFKPAVTALKKAIKFNPEIHQVYYHLGSVLRKLGKKALAVISFEEFLANTDSGPLKAKAQFHLGELAFDQKQFAQARQHLRACLTKLPQHKTALRRLKQIEDYSHA